MQGPSSWKSEMVVQYSAPVIAIFVAFRQRFSLQSRFSRVVGDVTDGQLSMFCWVAGKPAGGKLYMETIDYSVTNISFTVKQPQSH